MQTIPVNIEDGKKPTGANYMDEVNRTIREPIRKAIQTLSDQEGEKGKRASKLRIAAIDTIITRLKRWEQIDEWLNAANGKNMPELPVGIRTFALQEDHHSEAGYLGEKISTIGNLLDISDLSKDIPEGNSHTDLILSFAAAVNETSDRISELLDETQKGV